MRRLPSGVAAMSAALLLVAAPVSATASGDAENNSDLLYAPQSAPFGVEQERWFARWSTWMQGFPLPTSPVRPNSPRNCDVMGRVVFIGPTGAGASCSVPRGKAVAFTFAAWSCSTAEGNGETYRQLRRCAVRSYREATLPLFRDVRVRIDGTRLQRPRRWTVTSTGKVVDLPRNNLWGVEAGPTRTVVHGLFYMLKPLAPGNHEFVARGKQPGASGDDIVFRYAFTVRAG